jgi:hypothetical protein
VKYTQIVPLRARDFRANIENPTMECAMNEQTAALDQADEDILSYTVSDEALEAAAGTEVGLTAWTAGFATIGCC